MGIVNVTPDSFSDGGLYASTESALRHAARNSLKRGRIGWMSAGESTRPGGIPVSVEEELHRTIPVVQA